jgi:hypothetical protein
MINWLCSSRYERARGCSTTVVRVTSNHLMPVRFRSALLMDTMEKIIEMAEQEYPDDVDMQDVFIEGAILALHVINLADLKGT